MATSDALARSASLVLAVAAVLVPLLCNQQKALTTTAFVIGLVAPVVPWLLFVVAIFGGIS